MKRFFLTLTLLSSFLVFCIAQKHYLLKSPNGELIINIEVGDKISYSLQHKGKSVIVSSPISMLLDCDKTLGEKSKVKNVHMRKINETISTAFYKRNQIDNFCNELVITFKEDFQLNFRAYNEGMAYRFVVTQNRPFIVINEEATFNFEKDYMAYVPFVRGGRDKRKEEQFFNSFENVYTHLSLSEMPSNQIAFTPVVVELEEGRKICIAESDVESYPGMFVYNEEQSTSLKGVFAPYPKNLLQGGHNNLQMLVTERENYIAKCSGKRTFPWRIAIVSSDDKELLDNDYIFNLISHRNKIIVYSTNPINLLSKYRFDIFVKYYYVKSYIENYDLKEAKKIYLSHIKAFNNFHEPDGRKNNAKDFIIKFNSLIENIKSCKNLDKTIIPISTTGIPIDGAHRIAIALYFDLKIQYCVFDLLDGKYDEIFFLQRGMPY